MACSNPLFSLFVWCALTQLCVSPVMLVVSTRHPRPVEGFQDLYKLQKEAEKAQYPKWLTPNLYYYHVLLHDANEGSPVP